jgi:hypothetical protein
MQKGSAVPAVRKCFEKLLNQKTRLTMKTTKIMKKKKNKLRDLHALRGENINQKV